MRDPTGDPVPPGLVVDLGAAFRGLEALGDALFELEKLGAAPGLQEELVTVVCGLQR